MADGEHAAAAAATTTTTTTTTTGDNNPPLEAEQGPLVSVTFQKNPAYNQKYLEAQPKALGITQIGLSVYQMTWLCAILASSHGERNITYVRTAFIIASDVVVVAGSLAIAARSLHIPTLRACLVLQIFAIIASVFNLILVLLLQIDLTMDVCWYIWDRPNRTSSNLPVLCRQIEHAYSHYFAGGTLIQVALVAISVTVAAYCCKVVNCCAPASKMPVITVRAPPAPE